MAWVQLGCGLVGLVGLLVWWPGLAAGLLGLAALVHVPLILNLLGTPDDPAGRLLRAARRAQPVAALALVGSLSLEQGMVAGALAVPWLGLCGVLALAGGWRLLLRRGGPAAAVVIDGGLAFAAVGGAWTVATRAGIQPMGFSDTIVLLTAVHFHYAGLALPILAGLAGRVLPGTHHTAVVVGVLAGVPLVAIGISTTLLIEGFAAVVMATAGIGLGALQLRIAGDRTLPALRRGLLAISGLALLGGMALAMAYGVGAWLPARPVSIPGMVAMHGATNAIGFALLGLLAWCVPDRRAA